MKYNPDYNRPLYVSDLECVTIDFCATVNSVLQAYFQAATVGLVTGTTTGYDAAQTLILEALDVLSGRIRTILEINDRLTHSGFTSIVEPLLLRAFELTVPSVEVTKSQANRFYLSRQTAIQLFQECQKPRPIPGVPQPSLGKFMVRRSILRALWTALFRLGHITNLQYNHFVYTDVMMMDLFMSRAPQLVTPDGRHFNVPVFSDGTPIETGSEPNLIQRVFGKIVRPH